ncbi:MAG: enoyl-CoA hydratase/isomerase family protein, partial [Notoacmeibacter sp.]
DDIAFARSGSAIHVRLTRPKALNALTHNMAMALHAGLRAWECDDTVSHVLISAQTGEKKAFCAGGDIRDLYEGFKAGQPRRAFFQDEYRLNETIASFPKPYIALMDGMVMGGGAGISMHGSARIVTENTRFAMPEVTIGLVPDVGGSFVLPRLPNQYGFFLGLTGVAIDAEACLEAKIGTHFCAGNQIEALRAELLESSNPQLVLNKLRQQPQDNLLFDNAADISAAFVSNDSTGLIQQLELLSATNAFLALALKRIKSASPLSLCLAFELLQRGKELNLKQCLTLEYQLVSRILNGPDLYEGIRAAVIDRSMPAKWQHETIDAINAKLVSSFFASPPEGDLKFEF